MKQIKTILSALTIAAALSITTISCSSDDTLTTPPEQTQVTNGVQVTVGVSLADDAITRSEVTETTDANGKKRTLKFTSYDQLYVFGEIDGDTRVAGLLDMKNGTLSLDGKSAKFTGTIKAYDYSGTEKPYNFGDSDPLALCAQTAATGTVVQEGHTLGAVTISKGYPAQIDYSKMVAASVNTLMAEELYVHGAYVSSTKSFALSCNAPIINSTISGLTASKYYRAYLKKDGSGSDGVLFQSDANGVGAFAFATSHSGSGAYTIDITDNNTSATVGTIDLGTRSLEAKVYNVNRYLAGSTFAKPVSGSVNLATVGSDVVVLDGSVLTGTLGAAHKVSIAAGATVTLDGAVINDNGNVGSDNNIKGDSYYGRRWTNEKYAGLTCLGSATIVLKDGTANTMRGFDSWYPGIQAGPAGTTLTIRGESAGTGTLTVSSYFGAGIGAVDAANCGNIAIAGGTVNAASYAGAGIGTSAESSTCGTISITGGNVTAKSYSSPGSAGIGSGQYGSVCGNISITGSPTVSATGGGHAAGIGSGGYNSSASNAGSCGTIYISLAGGSVMATGATGAAGIGTGVYGTCGSITVERNSAASTQWVTVTANRGSGANNYDIGKGAGGTISGSVSVSGYVKTSNNYSYSGNSTDGYWQY